MEADSELGRFFILFWSTGAIIIGILALFFKEYFIRLNVRILMFLYRITKFPLFKYQADAINKIQFDLLVVGLGIFFIGLGIVYFIKNIPF